MRYLEERLYLTPNEFTADSDRRSIQNAVDEAALQEIRRVVIPAVNSRTGLPVWNLDAPVRLPSGMTVILDGCRVECKGTAFTNSLSDDPESRKIGCEQSDLFLIGRHGGTIRSGGKEPQIFLSNADKYRIDGIRFEGGGGIRLDFTRHGRLLGLRFSGSERGVVVAEGNRNLILENVAGETKEELIYLCGGPGLLFGRGPEIRDIILCRMQGRTQGAPAVSLLAGAVPLFNVVVRDLTDETAKGASVRIGDPSDGKEIRDITVRGVLSNRTSVMTCAVCDGMYYTALHSPEGVPALLRTAENTRELWDDDDTPVEPVQLPPEREDTPFLTPNEPAFFGADDAETIQNTINAAHLRGIDHVVIPRWNIRAGQPRWDIGRTLELPSCMTVELWSCHLRLEDFCYCSMFTNVYGNSTEQRTAAQEQKMITVTGCGDAVLDGGRHNGLLEKTNLRDGYPSIRNNTLLRFHNVSGLVIENFHLCRLRYYGVCLTFCDHGRVSNLDFYARELVPNLDGVDLRPGCHHFTVENITGTVSDDVVALNNLGGNLSGNGAVEGKEPHSHHILIRNIMADACRWYNVRLLVHDGIQLTDIVIDTVLDASLTELKKQPLAVVCVGWPEYYRDHPSKLGDLDRITIRDLYSRCERVIDLGGASSNVSIRNCHSYGDGMYWIVDIRMSAETENLYGKGWFYRPEQKSLYLIGDHGSFSDKSKYKGTLFSLFDLKGSAVFEDIFADKCKFAAWVVGKADVELKNFHLNEYGGEIPYFCGPDCRLVVNGEVIPCRDSIPADLISRISKWKFR